MEGTRVQDGVMIEKNNVREILELGEGDDDTCKYFPHTWSRPRVVGIQGRKEPRTHKEGTRTVECEPKVCKLTQASYQTSCSTHSSMSTPLSAGGEVGQQRGPRPG